MTGIPRSSAGALNVCANPYTEIRKSVVTGTVIQVNAGFVVSSAEELVIQMYLSKYVQREPEESRSNPRMI